MHYNTDDKTRFAVIYQDVTKAATRIVKHIELIKARYMIGLPGLSMEKIFLK